MRDSVFKMLSLLLINFCNSLWHAEYQLLGENLIDGDLFKHYQLQHARKWTDLNRIVPELLEENVFFPVWCHGEKKTNIWVFCWNKTPQGTFRLGVQGIMWCYDQTMINPEMMLRTFCAIPFRYFHAILAVLNEYSSYLSLLYDIIFCKFKNCCLSFLKWLSYAKKTPHFIQRTTIFLKDWVI